MHDVFVDLPNGEREYMPTNNGLIWEPEDEYVINEIHPFVTEAVAFGVETSRQLDRYMACRRKLDKDAAFSLAAYQCCRSLAPYEDGDTICFVSLNPGRADAKITNNFAIQMDYWKMRKNGESHRMAEMLATRSFPGIKSDAIFNEGRFSGEAGRIGVEQRWLQEQAEAVGVSTTGKFYCRGLADFPGDPTAWVSDRGDVLRVAREKNMTVHGYVEHKGRQVEPNADVRIADDLVEGEVDEIMAECPDADRETVREEVFAVRTGGVDPNDLRVGDYDESYLQPEA